MFFVVIKFRVNTVGQMFVEKVIGPMALKSYAEDYIRIHPVDPREFAYEIHKVDIPQVAIGI